jgi:hypothetical protein
LLAATLALSCRELAGLNDYLPRALGTSGSGGNGGVGGSPCSADVREAEALGARVFFAIDRSGSMEGPKWNTTTSAFSTFALDPASDELNVALRFWPDDAPGTCSSEQCDTRACSQPQIPVGSLADAAHEAAIVAALGTTTVGGSGTPLSAALAGATQWASEQAPGPPRAVVLLTDGEGTACTQEAAAIAAIAGDALREHGVLTFAIGLSGANAVDLDALAASGGTGAAYVIADETSVADLAAALASIAERLRSCVLASPAGAAPTLLNLVLSGDGDERTLARVANVLECGGDDGWYVDADTPGLFLCPTSCASLQRDPHLEVSIHSGCPGEDNANLESCQAWEDMTCGQCAARACPSETAACLALSRCDDELPVSGCLPLVGCAIAACGTAELACITTSCEGELARAGGPATEAFSASAALLGCAIGNCESCAQGGGGGAGSGGATP